MPDFDEIVRRLDRCNGPDTQLDETIALSVCDEHFFAQLADAPAGVGCEMYRIGTGSFSSALRVTASIDAAFALVAYALPDANCVGVEKDPHGWSAYVSRNCVPDGHWLFEAGASTAPVAIMKALFLVLAEKRQAGIEANKAASLD